MADRNVPKSEDKGPNIRIPDSTPMADQAVNINLDGEYIRGVAKENTPWDIYNNEARKVDNELVKDWTASLNFLLVFAAIFSAVLAAFIIESKKLLEQDQGALLVDFMILHANSVANGVRDIYTRPTFHPTSSAVSINCLLFGSLAASLVAALASVVSLQWVADFDAAITRGGSSPQDRAKRRQFRFAGVETWKMGGIIAALPLLLYFSVVLFFVGVIQWMFVINSTVGYVVTGGALIAALFYVLSTVIAVHYVTSPFKTPLSRSIYAIYHLPFVFIHWIIAMLRMKEVPQWIEKRRQTYYTAHKREDLAVESQLDLKYQAMHWLARQVSISDDSRQRLVLLATQLLDWPPAQLESDEFEQTPWVSILNFLAQRHRNAVHIQHQTEEEEGELALLVNCAALPAVRSLISPTERHDYDGDENTDVYWSQHCLTGDKSLAPLWRHLADLVEPETLFLITRDLPVPFILAADEIKITLQLAKWRNSERRSLDVWFNVFSSAKSFSDEFFSSCIIMLGKYATANARHQYYMLSGGQLGRVVAKIADETVTCRISSVALSALIRAFEVSLFIQSDTEVPSRTSKACLAKPLIYGYRLQHGNERELAMHRRLILLLARDIQGLSDSEQLLRFKELLGMIWISPLRRSALREPRWDDLANKHGQLCQLQDLNEEIVRDWILHADESPEIAETILILTQLSSDSQLGLRTLYRCSQQGGKHMLALLQLFDTLLNEDRKSCTPIRILKSLCTILRMNESEVNGRSTPSGTEGALRAFKTPFLRPIAYRALGTGHLYEGMLDQPFIWSEIMDETARYMFWNMSSKDTRVTWQIRAWLIFDSSAQNFCELVTRLLEDAFRFPGYLSHLQHILDERTQCHHYSGPGHLLRHLQSAVSPSIVFRSDTRLFETISLKNLKLPPITALLAVSSIDELSLLSLPQRVDKACMTQLWSYMDSLRNSQASVMGFLIDLPLYYPPAAKWGSFAILLRAIEGSILLPPEDRSIPLYLPLARLVLHFPYNEFLSQREGAKWAAEITALRVHGRRIADLALSKLAVVTISGRANLRLLACARPLWGTRPAEGHWPLYH